MNTPQNAAYKLISSDLQRRMGHRQYVAETITFVRRALKIR